MFDRGYLIRVCSGSFESWFSEKDSLPALFRHTDAEHSTYNVESDVDEALAVAAHQLISPSQTLDTQCALRIRISDLTEIGISVDRRHLGQTGVVKVDHSHCDLFGDKNTMTRLISWIRERSLKGEDRVRRFNKYQLRIMIERILDMGHEERPTRTAELCELVLKRRDRPTDDRERANQELTSMRIPDWAIRPVAFELFNQRSPHAGLARDDWFRAIDRLRARYRDHYMATHFVERP